MQNKKTPVLRWELLAALGVVAGAVSAPVMADEKPKQDDRNIQYRLDTDGKVTAVVPVPIPDSPAFARFDKWAADYIAANDENKVKLEGEGVRLAVARRQAMVELIQRDPKRALELAVYPEKRVQLPSRVVALLESFLQGRGQNNVSVSVIRERTPNGGKPVQTQNVARQIIERKFIFREQVYTPYFYGKREGMIGKSKLPFYGVALDGRIAIHENPLRLLASKEVVSSVAQPGEKGTKCPVCGAESKDGTVAILGTTVLYFDTPEHAQEYREQLWEAEQIIGPDAHG